MEFRLQTERRDRSSCHGIDNATTVDQYLNDGVGDPREGGEDG